MNMPKRKKNNVYAEIVVSRNISYICHNSKTDYGIDIAFQLFHNYRIVFLITSI
jgi:hypothetical protein